MIKHALINEENEVLIYPLDVRGYFANTSFPEEITRECLPSGVVEVIYSESSAGRFQEAVDHPELINGVWQNVWVYTDKDSSVIESSKAVAYDLIRAYRNELLTQCDWTQVADAPLSVEQRNAWVAYRQALRDLPDNTEDPFSVVYPQAPGA